MKEFQIKSKSNGGILQIVLIFSLLFSLGCTQPNSGQSYVIADNPEPAVDPENCNIIVGESVSYKGLEIFPISLKSESTDLNYFTLAEAIAEKKLIVEETGNVNQLTVSNVSDSYVFIMAGDIIKGGKQDRTLGVDAIIPPKTKKMPIDSYCVESGRWQQRGSENVQQFSGNTKTLSSRKLKLASKYNKNQSDVWEKVAEQQDKLNINISELKGENVNVRSEDSHSSLQLTLESKDLKEIMDEYKKNLDLDIESNMQQAGFAYAINGEIYGIDVFNDSELFERLSKKLYESVIVEAISEYMPDSAISSIDNAAIYDLYMHSFKNKAEKQNVNKVTEMLTYDSEKAVLFETDNSDDELWIHKNYIPKKEGDFNKTTNSRINIRQRNNIQLQE